MSIKRRVGNERGIALMVVLLLAFAISAIALGAAMMSSSTRAINLYSDRLGLLETAAEAGIEVARSRVNGNKTLYPDSLYSVLEDGVSVADADGNPIPGLRRYTYVGPTGVTSGQYGVFGSIVTVVVDDAGNQIVRRGEVFQESFAKFAYFTNIEGNIWFGGGDQIWGPVHSNDRIQIYTSGATFHSTVKTGKYIYQPWYATFKQGYAEYAPTIPMPQTADLLKLKNQALVGNTRIVGNTSGGYGEATTRIEFIAIDLNGDGDVTDDDEGFMRVYQSANAGWVTGDRINGTYLTGAVNCGDFHGGQFVTAAEHNVGGNPYGHNGQTSVTNPPAANRPHRCYLGGADELNNPDGFAANDSRGAWLPWPGPLITHPVVQARPDAAYLFPINRGFNPSFKGVVYVEGNVALSGVLRGRITLAASGDIVFADDVRYATNPGAGTCNDALGVFAGGNVIVADNNLNAPVRPASGWDYRTYDDTKDEFFDAVVLTLNIFTVENYNSGSSNDQACEGKIWGRGCLYLTGGIIQRQRGAVGLTSGRGYVKRYTYDQCAATEPPPYFPTTGRFSKGRFFEVDPVGFDVASYYKMLTPY